MFYNKSLIAAKLRRWEKYLNNYTLPKWDELPTIDLYMDQVIALLNQYLDFLPKDDVKDEKIVTPVAINNYVRMKIMPAPVKKKYSKIHIAYLIMICTLKQCLSISNVSKMIPNGLSEEEVKVIYDDYVMMHKRAALYFIDQVRKNARPVLDADDESENAVANLVASASAISTFSRLLTEKILNLKGVDDLPADELVEKRQ